MADPSAGGGAAVRRLLLRPVLLRALRVGPADPCRPSRDEDPLLGHRPAVLLAPDRGRPVTTRHVAGAAAGRALRLGALPRLLRRGPDEQPRGDRPLLLLRA